MEIKFDKQTFSLFNADDQFGLFNDKIHRIVNGLGRIDPSSTSLFDYDGYITKLMIQLFLKYNYVVVTDKDCFWGVLNDHKTIIKPNVSGSFLKAQEFMSNQDIKIIGQVKDKVA